MRGVRILAPSKSFAGFDLIPFGKRISRPEATQRANRAMQAGNSEASYYKSGAQGRLHWVAAHLLFYITPSKYLADRGGKQLPAIPTAAGSE